jgi:hypothetical protein
MLLGSPDAGKEAPGRLARLWCNRSGGDLALGVGTDLPDALHALEQDLLSASPVGAQVSQHPCEVCAMKALVRVVAGSPKAVSVLDGHLLAGDDFQVEWREEQFHFTAEWTRKADTLAPR